VVAADQESVAPTPEALVVAGTGKAKESDAPDSHRFVVFRAAGGLALAMPFELVLEVGPVAECRRLPNGPSHLSGVTKWRGRLVPLVNFAERLGSTASEATQTLFVALEGRAAAALAVSTDEVLGSAVISTEPRPGDDLGVPAAWVRGVARFAGHLVPVLDPNALVVG
jgi:chemotaxis signal transduction protein